MVWSRTNYSQGTSIAHINVDYFTEESENTDTVPVQAMCIVWVIIPLSSNTCTCIHQNTSQEATYICRYMCMYIYMDQTDTENMSESAFMFITKVNLSVERGQQQGKWGRGKVCKVSLLSLLFCNSKTGIEFLATIKVSLTAYDCICPLTCHQSFSNPKGRLNYLHWIFTEIAQLTMCEWVTWC